MRLLAQLGIAAELIGIAGVVEAGGVVVGQAALQRLAGLSLVHLTCVAAVAGAGGLVIIAGQRHAAGDDLAHGLPVGQAVLFLGGVGAVETHAGRAAGGQAEGIVKHCQPNLRAIAINVFEAPGETFLMHQPHDEIEVALFILQAVAAHGLVRIHLDVQRLHAGKGRIGGLMLADDLFDDVRHRHVLEHAGSAAMAQQRKGWLHRDAIAGKAAIAAEQARLADHAATHVLAAFGIHQADAGRVAEQGLEFDLAIWRQAIQLEAVGAGYAFLAVQRLRQQLFRAGGVAGDGKGDMAVGLGKGGGEGGEQGGYIHGSSMHAPLNAGRWSGCNRMGRM